MSAFFCITNLVNFVLQLCLHIISRHCYMAIKGAGINRKLNNHVLFIIVCHLYSSQFN